MFRVLPAGTRGAFTSIRVASRPYPMTRRREPNAETIAERTRCGRIRGGALVLADGVHTELLHRCLRTEAVLYLCPELLGACLMSTHGAARMSVHGTMTNLNERGAPLRAS